MPLCSEAECTLKNPNSSLVHLPWLPKPLSLSQAGVCSLEHSFCKYVWLFCAMRPPSTGQASGQMGSRAKRRC